MKENSFVLRFRVIIVLLLLLPLADVGAEDDYFIYANFNSSNTGGVYVPGQGCGGYKIDDTTGHIYIARYGGYCDIYKVSIPAGSDPNMHPSNPYAAGPMAPRILTLVSTYDFSTDCGWFGEHNAEFYVDENYIYYGPDYYGTGGIEKWAKNSDGTFGTYLGRLPIPVPPENGETFGYDSNNDIWYTCSRSRNIYSFEVGLDTTWQYEFTYPNYSGSHHDGLEFVSGYLWLSDMYSDTIGQWERVGSTWREKNRFSYSDTADEDVEGMGFGPLGHFWITSWSTLYEIGGGELQAALEGIPDQCVLAGDIFDTFDLDNYVRGRPPFTWSWSGNQNCTISVDSKNVVTVAYPTGWVGSDTVIFTVTDSSNTSDSDDVIFTIDPFPLVGDIPDQTTPFNSFDLDNYLFGIDSNQVTWMISGVRCLEVNLDSITHLVTITDRGGCTEPETLTFIATAVACGEEISDSDQAVFAATDTIPPEFELISPDLGQNGTNVPFPIDQIIHGLFSERIDATTLNANSFEVKSKNKGSVSGTLSYDSFRVSVRFVPDSFLPPDDFITVTVSNSVTDLFGNPLKQTYMWNFGTGPGVYPGDTDNDGVVNEIDVLPLGIFWGDTGTARDSTGNSWSIKPVIYPWDPGDATYADANGDGQVTEADLLAIGLNWGKTHLYANPAKLPDLFNPQTDKSHFIAGFQKLYQAVKDNQSDKMIKVKKLLEKILDMESAAVKFVLYQNYPNPFNPVTELKYTLPKESHVRLIIYNVLGQRVRVLVDKNQSGGHKSIRWDGKDDQNREVASGIYFYKIQAGDFVQSKKMLLVK